MLSRLFLLFVIVPLAELALLIRLGQWIGLGPTVGIVFATGLLGAYLARSQGLRVWFEVQGELARGGLPGRSLLDGLCVLLGGAFLLTPGVLTDLVGMGLLIPLTRRWIQGWMRRRLTRAVEAGTIRVQFTGPGAPAHPPAASGGEVGRAEIRDLDHR